MEFRMKIPLPTPVSSLAFFALALSLGSCETVGSDPAPFDPRTKEAIVADTRELIEEQQALLADVENTAKVSYMLSETEGKPDQKAIENFNERVVSLEARINAYKARLNSLERDTLGMTQRWREGMTSIRDEELDRVSRENLDDTRKAYDEMNMALRANYSKMDRISRDLRDHRVFLQVNPVAEASATLKDRLRPMSSDINDLRGEVEKSEELAAAFQKKLRE
jgi:hypothetical protein